MLNNLRQLRYFVNVLNLTAAMSRSARLQVGALLIRDTRIVSMGYNGTPHGEDNCCEDEFGNTKPEVLHAELNAIAKIAQSSDTTEGCILLCTHSPCYECAKLIIASGIKQVIYLNEFRDTRPIELLKKMNIDVSLLRL